MAGTLIDRGWKGPGGWGCHWGAAFEDAGLAELFAYYFVSNPPTGGALRAATAPLSKVRPATGGLVCIQSVELGPLGDDLWGPDSAVLAAEAAVMAADISCAGPMSALLVAEAVRRLLVLPELRHQWSLAVLSSRALSVAPDVGTAMLLDLGRIGFANLPRMPGWQYTSQTLLKLVSTASEAEACHFWLHLLRPAGALGVGSDDPERARQGAGDNPAQPARARHERSRGQHRIRRLPAVSTAPFGLTASDCIMPTMIIVWGFLTFSVHASMLC